MSIWDFLDNERGQDRTRALNEFLGSNLDYLLGPTGIPDKVRSLNALLNPIDQASQAGADTVMAMDPNRSDEERKRAAMNALVGTIGAAAPALVAGRAGMPAASAIAETLTGVGGGMRNATDGIADAIPSEALYAGRSLAEGDMRGVLDAFTPGRPAQGLGADVVKTSLPAPRNAAEAAAKDVLDLRAAGRASEVTDEMMAAADPEYMYFNTPLPMDEASRMGRAQGVRALHGTGADISAVDPAYFGNGQDLLGTGFYTTTANPRAERYVPSEMIDGEKVFAEGGNVMPLMVREPRPFMLDESLGGAADEIASIYRQDPFFEVDEMSSGVKIVRDGDGKSVMLDPYQQRHWTLQNMRKSYGPSDTSDVLSEAGYSGVSGPEGAGGRVRLSYDPTDIRSRFARFDPEFAHLRNLSAGVGGAGLLSTMMPQEEQY